jgi:hypothetical protein
MARTRPTSEPSSLRAGETWDWERTLSDYPAAEWTLSYTFTNATAKIAITASADGDTHVVTVAKATTAAYAAGRYDGFAQVTDGTETYGVWSGVLEVLPDLASATAYDGRSVARQCYDALTAILTGRSSAEDWALVQASIGDRAQSLDQAELRKWLNFFAAQVKAEDDALRIARGEGLGRLFQVRFGG